MEKYNKNVSQNLRGVALPRTKDVNDVVETETERKREREEKSRGMFGIYEM